YVGSETCDHSLRRDHAVHEPGGFAMNASYTCIATSARSVTRPKVMRMAVALLMALLLGAGAFAQGDSHPVEGLWEGAIEIPGSPLGVAVTLERSGETWTGTIDIPAQGAIGAPLDRVR